MCEIVNCETCEREHVCLEDHELCCYRVYVKSMFAGVMYGFVLSALFILRL